MAGIYVHIPFCESRCVYCGFYSTTHPELQSRYVKDVLGELRLRAGYLGDEPVSTVYLGGGTPSMLSDDNLTLLISALYDLVADKTDYEMTVECNPEDITPERAELLGRLPVNRVSMGVQTFSDDRLRWLCRRHDSRQAATAVERLRKAGCANLSLDLMFGFPGQTVDQCRQDVERMIDLRPEHISAYSLQYEEGTRLYTWLKQGRVSQVDDEVSLAMYNMIVDRLEAAGYEHYEISNFALTDGGHGRSPYRSRHNSSYWNDTHYLGLGAAAHSYDGRSRQWNVSNISAYMESIENGRVPAEGERIDADTHYDDTVTTALRTREGIDIKKLEPKYRRYILAQADSWIRQGRLCLDNESGRLHLTRRGLYISDTIMSDLMFV